MLAKHGYYRNSLKSVDENLVIEIGKKIMSLKLEILNEKSWNFSAAYQEWCTRSFDNYIGLLQ